MELHDSHEWMLWQAREAVGEGTKVSYVDVVPKDLPLVSVVMETNKKRKRHWAGSFQKRFAHWLKGNGERPCNLGYTRRELMRHLERQFAKGMSWDNYAANCAFKSKDVWVVDHIVPKLLFDEDDVVHAYALANLRPLWMKQNMRKGAQREHLI